MVLCEIKKNRSDEEIIELFKNKDNIKIEYDKSRQIYTKKEKEFRKKYQELIDHINELHSDLQFIQGVSELYEDQYPLKIYYYDQKSDGVEGTFISSPLSHKRTASYFEDETNFFEDDENVFTNYHWDKQEFIKAAKEYVAKGITPD